MIQPCPHWIGSADIPSNLGGRKMIKQQSLKLINPPWYLCFRQLTSWWRCDVINIFIIMAFDPLRSNKTEKKLTLQLKPGLNNYLYYLPITLEKLLRIRPLFPFMQNGRNEFLNFSRIWNPAARSILFTKWNSDVNNNTLISSGNFKK